jgi:hypothetical protein
MAAWAELPALLQLIQERQTANAAKLFKKCNLLCTRNDVLQLYTPLTETAEVLIFQVFDRYGGLVYKASGLCQQCSGMGG